MSFFLSIIYFTAVCKVLDKSAEKQPPHTGRLLHFRKGSNALELAEIGERVRHAL